MARDKAFLAALRIAPAPDAFIASDFDCGEQDLTDYLCDGTSAADQAAGVSRSYLVHENGHGLVGYFTVPADSIRLENKERPSGLMYPNAPAIKLGRMGVHSGYRGRGVGPWILDNVVGLAIELSKQVGIRYVTLDALQRDRLIAFYEDYGFVRNKGERKASARILNLSSWRDLRRRARQRVRRTLVVRPRYADLVHDAAGGPPENRRVLTMLVHTLRCMTGFEWDPEKAASNIAKHGVDFVA